LSSGNGVVGQPFDLLVEETLPFQSETTRRNEAIRLNMPPSLFWSNPVGIACA
jgi:hypothetical protein